MPPHPPSYFQIPMTPVPTKTKEHVRPKRKPLLRLEIRDLSEEGARSFLSLLDCSTVLEEAVNGVLDLLYSPHSHIPPTRSVTLVLRSMPGVAFTTGKDLDDDHKEIHFSTDYIANIPKERRKSEMLGVLRHEMVHCWQWNAKGTCPGGLVEGIADFVRLRSGMSPPHWKREWGKNNDWDAGYQHTAYFLDYLEERFGDGTVMAINEHLREQKYKEETFWQQCCGADVKTLWNDYGEKLKKDKEHEKEPDHGKKPDHEKNPHKDDFLEVVGHEQKSDGSVKIEGTWQPKHVRRSSDVVSPADGVTEGSEVSNCGKETWHERI